MYLTVFQQMLRSQAIISSLLLPPLFYSFTRSNSVHQVKMAYDFEEYSKYCSTLTPAQLQQQWERYSRKVSKAKHGTSIAFIGLHVVAAHCTFGLSLCLTAAGAATIYNAIKKCEIIKKHLAIYNMTHGTHYCVGNLTEDVTGVAIQGLGAALSS